MGFLKKFFAGKNKKNDPGDNATPTRGLNLQFEIIPGNGAEFANQFVQAVIKTEQFQLDYSIDSLKFVDEFLQRFSDEGLTVNDFAETIFVSGAYIGEVMVKNNAGYWIFQEEANPPNGIKMMPIIVKLSNGNVADPIAKAFKRFHYGKVEDLMYFYYVFTKDPE